MKNTYESQGLTVIAVNLDRERADAEQFLARFRHDFDIRFDPQGALAEKYKVEGMPTSVVLDRNGVLRFTHIGFKTVDRDAYEKQIRDLLTEK